MQYPVIIEQKNGSFRAVIPALANLSVEGNSAVEALQNAQQAAKDFLASVTIATIEIPNAQDPALRPGSPQSVLNAAGTFVGDEEAMLQHIEEIYAERRRQAEETDADLNEVAA